MASLLTDAEKASIVADFKSGIDTFVRPFTIYQEAAHIVLITDPNYNPLEAYNQNSTSITNVPNYTTISGRILYDKNQEWSFINPLKGGNAAEIKEKDQTSRSVRLKVDGSGYALLQTAKKVQIDGNLFDLASIARPHGLFGTETYTFYFVRSM
jgi:hypothetical protein